MKKCPRTAARELRLAGRIAPDLIPLPLALLHSERFSLIGNPLSAFREFILPAEAPSLADMPSPLPGRPDRVGYSGSMSIRAHSTFAGISRPTPQVACRRSTSTALNHGRRPPGHLQISRSTVVSVAAYLDMQRLSEDCRRRDAVSAHQVDDRDTAEWTVSTRGALKADNSVNEAKFV